MRPNLLEVSNLTVSYGPICALRDINLEVKQGSIVTLLGANGAGKSTFLRAVSALIKPQSGEISFEGRSILGAPAYQIVKRGISHVPEGRLIFPELTVRENLEMGAYVHRGSSAHELELVFSLFPRLAERLTQVGCTLSGGEQQMLAIGRALMAKPTLLLLDEPSLGIAPVLVRTIFAKIVEINQRLGMTILLVEQNSHLALGISDYAYVLETGDVVLEGPAAALRENSDVKKVYLGEV